MTHPAEAPVVVMGLADLNAALPILRRPQTQCGSPSTYPPRQKDLIDPESASRFQTNVLDQSVLFRVNVVSCQPAGQSLGQTQRNTRGSGLWESATVRVCKLSTGRRALWLHVCDVEMSQLSRCWHFSKRERVPFFVIIPKKDPRSFPFPKIHTVCSKYVDYIVYEYHTNRKILCRL